MTKNLLRRLPAVDRLLKTEKAKALAEKFSHNLVVDAARIVLEELRLEILNSKTASSPEGIVAEENILRRIESYLQKKFSPSLKRAINATGVILHTGLGRAVLSKEALDAI